MFSNVLRGTSNVKEFQHRVASIEVPECKCIRIFNASIDEYFQCDHRVLKIEMLNEIAFHEIFLLQPFYTLSKIVVILHHFIRKEINGMFSNSPMVTVK